MPTFKTAANFTDHNAVFAFMTHAGELSALFTAILWTGSALAFASAIQKAGSVYVNIVRLAISITFLFLTLFIFQIDCSFSPAQAWYLILSGLAGFVFGDTFLFKSYEYNDARIGSLVMSTSPAMAAILAYFFLQEEMTLAGIIGMSITLGGIALVVLEQKEPSTHHTPVSMIGMFYTLLGAAGQAVGLIFAKKAFEFGYINGFVATLIRSMAAIIVLLPLNYFAHRFIHPLQVFRKNRTALFHTTLGAFVGPYLGVTFSLIAISYTDVAVASTIMSTVPILMLPAVWFIFHERLSWRAIAGACIAVAGVGILFLR